MKIDHKILQIPPHISTSWDHVRSLHTKGNLLIVNLTDGDSVSIPDLSQETLERIFESHAEYLDKQIPQKLISSDFMNQNRENPEFRFAFGSLDNLGGAMQHNPSQSNMPELPAEILNKISSIAKIVASEETGSFSKSEPNCNCIHCQISRSMHTSSEEKVDEIVLDNDLQFQSWEIQQVGDQLFQVTNRLDRIEQYNVFLGNPVGCTCGKEGCEHVIAVLKS